MANRSVNERVSVTFLPDIMDDIESLMQATGRRKSQVIRDAVEIGLRELKRQKSAEGTKVND